MLATTAFVAPFGFVVWTFSSLYGLGVKSLHVPRISRLRSGLACGFRHLAFPEFAEFYYEAPEIGGLNGSPIMHGIGCPLAMHYFKPVALTN